MSTEGKRKAVVACGQRRCGRSFFLQPFVGECECFEASVKGTELGFENFEDVDEITVVAMTEGVENLKGIVPLEGLEDRFPLKTITRKSAKPYRSLHKL